MGLRNNSKYLDKILSRILGDLTANGILARIADGLVVGGSTINGLLFHWTTLLQRLSNNNLHLTPTKTVIRHLSTSIVGWIWRPWKIIRPSTIITTKNDFYYPTPCNQLVITIIHPTLLFTSRTRDVYR